MSGADHIRGGVSLPLCKMDSVVPVLLTFPLTHFKNAQISSALVITFIQEFDITAPRNNKTFPIMARWSK